MPALSLIAIFIYLIAHSIYDQSKKKPTRVYTTAELNDILGMSIGKSQKEAMNIMVNYDSIKSNRKGNS